MGKNINATRYVCYVKCPNCGELGILAAHWSANRSTQHWCGPYFSVHHKKHVYNPEIYKKLRETMTPKEAQKREARNPNNLTRSCYFGQKYPGPEDTSQVPNTPPEKKRKRQ